MTIKVYIAGVDRTGYLVPQSGRIARRANGVADFQGVFRAEITDGYVPVRGQQIKVSDGGAPETVWFAGHISRIEQSNPPRTGFLEFRIDCTDFNRITTRRLISGTYGEGMSLHDIVLRIVETGLSDEGITTDNVADDSPPLTIDEKLVFSYETVKSAFDRLAALTGYVWWIDFDKDLHFCLPTAESAPFDLTDTEGQWFDLKIETSDEDYRNRQHERSQSTVAASAGSATGESPWTASAGASLIPTLAVVTELLEVIVDGIAKTFLRVEEGEEDPVGGADFFYRPNWCGIQCLDIGNFVGGEICTFEYRPGPMPATEQATQGTGVQVVTVEDTAEQAARAAIEGGSGIWEAVEEQRWLGTVAALQALGEGRLRQHAIEAQRVMFGTYQDGLAPGQQIHIQNTSLDLDDDYFIEEVNQEWETGADDFFRYRVACTLVEPYGPVVGYIEKLAEMARIGPAGGDIAVTDRGGSISSGAGSGAVIVEAPKGLKDGSNLTFWLTYWPGPPESLRLSVNGVIQNPYSDYTLSQNVITFTAAPDADDDLLAWYFHGTKATVPKDDEGNPLTQARYFGDEVGDDISWAGVSALTGDMALGVWVKFPSNAGGPIFSQGHHLGVYGMNFQLLVEGVSGAWDLRYKHQYGGAFGTDVTAQHLFDTDIPNDTWVFVGLMRDATTKRVYLYLGYEGDTEVELFDDWDYGTAGYSNPSNPAGWTYIGQCPGNWDAPLAPRFTAQEHYLWDAAANPSVFDLAMKGDLVPTAKQNLKLACYMGADPEIDVSGNGLTGTIGSDPQLVAGHH